MYKRQGQTQPQLAQPQTDAFAPYGQQVPATAESHYPHVAQEYQPPAQIAANGTQHHYVDPVQAAQIPPPPAMSYASPYDAALAQNQYDPATGSQTSPYEPQAYAASNGSVTEYVPPQTISNADLPYDNPGYGEAGTSEMDRPGHVDKKSKKKKSKGKSLLSGSALSSIPLSGRNLRVAGLAVALAAVGIFGFKTFMGGGEDVTQRPENTIAQPINGGALSQPTVMAESSVETTDPIGAYADNGASLSAPTALDNNLDTSGTTGEPMTLEAAAADGNSVAQFQLGITYLDAGQTEQGLKFIRAAANQGQPAAQYRLAKLYEAGVGVPADPDMARQLTQRAALAGNRIAMHDLGLYYAEGRGGVDSDMRIALSWFEKAANRGVVDSQYNLGVLFGSTPEIPTDLVSAYVWFSIASQQGDQLAGNNVSTLKTQLEANDLKRAEERIAAFKPMAIDEAANGIFRDVAWVGGPGETVQPSAALVKDAQSLLNDLGYDVGTPDGDMGPKTRAAVIAFEKANGLRETGVVSATLVDQLEAASGA